MDDRPEKLTFFGRIRKFLKVNLIAGLLFLTPIAATFFLLRLTIGWLDQILLFIPVKYRPESFLPFPVPGLGVIVLVLVLIFSGVFVRNYLGKKLVSIWESIINYIPIVNKVYTAVKQLINTIAKGAPRDFKRVVLIEYPKENIFAMAYVTGVAVGELQEKTKRKMISVFMCPPLPTLLLAFISWSLRMKPSLST